MFTGFTQDEFDRIFKKINKGHETCEKWRLNRKDRKRAFGAGRKFKLVLRERFLMQETQSRRKFLRNFRGIKIKILKVFGAPKIKILRVFLFIIVFTLPVH